MELDHGALAISLQEMMLVLVLTIAHQDIPDFVKTNF